VNGVVTGMTQYYSSLYVPGWGGKTAYLLHSQLKLGLEALANCKAVIEEQVLAYCSRVIPLLPLATCTLDVGMDAQGGLFVVEVNPPAPRWLSPSRQCEVWCSSLGMLGAGPRCSSGSMAAYRVLATMTSCRAKHHARLVPTCVMRALPTDSW
jgi:hypothetical protein